jgi:maleate isomerase
LGFLLPPGNPTVEPEMIALAPEGVSVHFHRMTARGATGSLEGQDERNRMMVDNIGDSIELLAMVSPDVIVLAHTATSYHLGRQGEADLLRRLEESTGRRVITAFGSVVRAGAAQCSPAGARHTLFTGNDGAGKGPFGSARARGRELRKSAGGYQYL